MNNAQKIAEIVRKVANKPVAPEPEDQLFETGYLDSFVLTDLVMELEKQFGIRIPDSDLNPRRFESVERIEALLESRSAKTAS
jgi:acyl carrier protein